MLLSGDIAEYIDDALDKVIHQREQHRLLPLTDLEKESFASEIERILRWYTTPSSPHGVLKQTSPAALNDSVSNVLCTYANDSSKGDIWI